MHSSFWTYLKRATVIALIVGPVLALVSVDVEAGRRGGGGGGGHRIGHGGGGGGGGGGVRAPRANIGGGGGGANRRDINRRDVSRRDINRRDVNRRDVNRRDVDRRDINRRDIDRRNVNRRDIDRRDVNINRNVNVDVDRHWGYSGGAAVAAVGAAVAVGAIVSSLPPDCRTIVVDGVSYRDCGGTYYVPSYDGPNVVYEAVPPPSGWNR